MAERIGINLYRLDIPLVGNPLKNLNSYLITGERNLLIDTGFREEACRTAMERQLQELHVDLSRTDIFLTHLHSDHSGLSTELHRPGCGLMISREDQDELTLRGDDRFWRLRNEQSVRDGFSREEMDVLWGSNPAKEMAPEIADRYDCLKDGDTLEYGGYRLRCILTPGHSPGHLCLYDEDRRVFFAGDHILFHITPNICRWESMPDALGSYLNSLKLVEDLPVEQLLPAHRAETGALKDRALELSAHHRRRLKDTLAVVRAHPGLTAYQIAGAMRWQIRSRNWAEFPLNQKFFAVGEALSHLDYLRLRGQLEMTEQNGKLVWYASPGQNKPDHGPVSAQEPSRPPWNQDG